MALSVLEDETQGAVSPPACPAPPPARAPRPKRSTPLHQLLLLIAALLIGGAVAVPAALIYFVAYTQSGLQLIVRCIPRRIGDVGLRIDDVTGTLAHGIRIGSLEVDERVVRVIIQGADSHVALMPLLWQTIRSPYTYARSVTVEIKPHPKPPTHHIAPLFLPRWLVINAEHVQVGVSTIVLASGYRLVGTQIDTSALLRHKSIRFYEAEVQYGNTHFSAIGLLRAAEPLKIDADGRIQFSPAKQPAWLLSATMNGDLDSLAITAHTIRPFRSDFTGRALSLTHRTRRWLGNATVHDFDLAAWHTAGPLGVINGQLHLQGDSHGFTAQGTALPAGLHAGLFDVGFDGYYAKHVLTARHLEVRHRASGAYASGSGTFGVVKNGPLLDLKGTWKDLRWPLTGAAPSFRSSSAQFSFKGLLPYHVQASGIATVGSLPAAPMQIDGILGRHGFKLDAGEVDLFDGHARASGAVTWSPAHTWSVTAEVEGLNPASFRPDLPGRLGFTIQAHAHSFSPSADVDVEIRDLAGELRGVPASGGGRILRQARTWLFDDVHLNAGGTHLALDGHIDQQMDLRFSASSEDLGLFAPDTQGQLQATAIVRGTLEVPVINASFHGTGIRHGAATLADLEGLIDFDPHPQRESKVELHLRNLKLRRRTLQSFDLSLNGTPDSYTLRGDVKAIGLTASARAVGAYSRGQFAGVLEGLTVRSKESLHLTLANVVGLHLSPSHAQVEWLCLKGKPASVCADAEWSPSQWSTTFTASELPIETLTSGMTVSNVSYQGTVKLLARLFGNGHDPVQGTVRAELTNAQLSHSLLSGRVEHTSIGSGTINCTASRNAISAAAYLQDGQIGTLRAKLVAQRGAARWQDMPVEGELHAQTTQLALASLYLPDIDQASGRLTADAQISGTFGTPFLGGQLQIADGQVDLYQVNLRPRGLNLTAHFTDDGLDFTGQAQIGSGLMNTTGHLAWHDGEPHGNLILKGSHLRVVDLPEAHIDASPDLKFNIAGKRIEVTGSVDVPYAKITPRDLTGAVRTSSDEVIVGSGAPDVTHRFQVLSTINLHLGDHVNIETSGLTARLTGTLAVKSGYDALTRATGTLSVPEGKYVAYAHNFDIQHGSLIFTGGDVDNPGIEIKAARKFPGVTAGVNVRGTLLQPRISFFSEPSLPQAEIVSLILSGGSLETAQAKSGTASNEALAQGGAMLLQEVGSRLGIEDVGVEANQYIQNDSSLVLGKYLSPRLYVSYGVSLTEELQVLKLRYSLGDHWTVTSEVGQARGADLEFSIDR